MFSSRVPGDFAPNVLSRRIDERRAKGDLLLDMIESNPTRAGFLAPADVLALLGRAEGAHYAPDPRGLLAPREAVCRDYASRGVAVSPDHVVLTASSSESYSLLFKLLAEPGDEILVPSPSYPLFEHLARLDGLSVRTYPFRYDQEWHVSVDALAGLMTPRTRAVVVVHPNNPTGSFLKRDESDALVSLCARSGVAIIADEVFADFAFDDDPHRAGSFAASSDALCFALGGLSKSCGLPQLKLGWIAASGPSAPLDEALTRLEFVADTYLSVATPIQLALGEILARKADLQAPIKERLRRNLSALAAAAPIHPELSILDVEGGWCALLRCPATRSDEERALMALDEGVIVHPGHFFDLDGGCFLVISLLCDPALFDEGLPRLLDAAVR